jgi:pyridoxine 5'-phosphate synthase PdxJ
MNKLREKIFAWILKRQPARTIIMPQWDKVRSVVVLYPNNNIQHIIQQLKQMGKEVVIFTMPDKKQINWLTERPKTEIRELVMARHFDILIDLTQHPSLTMQYLAMDIRADFKVGRFINEGIHDLTIDTAPQEAPDYLFEQIIKYVEMFGRR